MNELWHTLGLAAALMLIMEGLLPFLDPARYRRYLERVLSLDDNALRMGGLVAITLGVLLLYLL